MIGFLGFLVTWWPFDLCLLGGAAMTACAWLVMCRPGTLRQAMRWCVLAGLSPATAIRHAACCLPVKQWRAGMSSRGIRRRDWEAFCAELDLIEVVLIAAATQRRRR